MTNSIDATKLADVYAFIASRQDEILRLIYKLVETESPSGDVEGSRAVVDLLEKAAHAISSVSRLRRASTHQCFRRYRL